MAFYENTQFSGEGHCTRISAEDQPENKEKEGQKRRSENITEWTRLKI